MSNKRFTAVLFAGALSVGLVPDVMAACATDGSGLVQIDASSPGDTCNGLEPDGYQVKLYYLGLCQSSATMPTTSVAGDYSACTTIFESAAGESLNLAVGESVDLTGAEKPANGSYGYGVAVIANTFGITHTEEFSATDNASNAVTVTGKTGTGTVCWSTGGTYYSSAFYVGGNWSNVNNFHTACGSSAGTASMTTEILDSFGMNNANTAYLFSWPETGSGEAVTGGTMAASITDNNLVQASSTGSATKIMAQITFTNPVVVSDRTVNADLRFNVTQGSSLVMEPGGSPGDYSLWSFGSGPFSVVIQTTDN